MSDLNDHLEAMNEETWKYRARRAEARLQHARNIIESLLGLELGSSERALEFLHSAPHYIEESGPVPDIVWEKHR